MSDVGASVNVFPAIVPHENVFARAEDAIHAAVKQVAQAQGHRVRNTTGALELSDGSQGLGEAEGVTDAEGEAGGETPEERG